MSLADIAQGPAAAPMAPEPTQQAEMPPQAAPASEGGQEQYERFYARGIKLIYRDDVLPMVVKNLTTGDLQHSLAQTAALIVKRTEDAANKAGIQVSEDVIKQAGSELFGELAELATKLGAGDYSNDPDALEGAFFEAVDTYRVMKQKQGQIDPQKAQQSLSELQSQDQSGELENTLRELSAPQGVEQ